jgi:hypothetical protein
MDPKLYDRFPNSRKAHAAAARKRRRQTKAERLAVMKPALAARAEWIRRAAELMRADHGKRTKKET